MNCVRDHLLTIVTNVVEQNGCKLVEIDFKNHILNIDGTGGEPGPLRPRPPGSSRMIRPPAGLKPAASPASDATRRQARSGSSTR